jgi:hypothetical protein
VETVQEVHIHMHHPEREEKAEEPSQRKLQTMSPEEWRRELNSDRLANTFSAGERDLLNQLLSLSANPAR